MGKNFKIAATATCTAACLALIGMWVRSYSVIDWTTLGLKAALFSADSETGRITLSGFYRSTQGQDSQLFWSWVPSPRRAPLSKDWTNWGFYKGKRNIGVSFPYWLPVAILASCAAAPWFSWRRFTTRRLLLVMTVIAAILGLARLTN